MGPPGSRKKEKALTLAGYFNYEALSVSDLLENEVGKKSEQGKKIAEAKATNTNSKIIKYNFINININIVDDDIVMELVNNEIQQFEKKGKSYIIAGYPRTRVQALSLQRMGITPDKFFVLTMNDSAISQKIKSGLPTSMPEETGKPRRSLTVDYIDSFVKNAKLEYNL